MSKRNLSILLSIIVGVILMILGIGMVYHIIHSPNYIYQYRVDKYYWNLAGEEIKVETEYYDPTCGHIICYVLMAIAGMALGSLIYFCWGKNK